VCSFAGPHSSKTTHAPLASTIPRPVCRYPLPVFPPSASSVPVPRHDSPVPPSPFPATTHVPISRTRDPRPDAALDGRHGGTKSSSSNGKARTVRQGMDGLPNSRRPRGMIITSPSHSLNRNSSSLTRSSKWNTHGPDDQIGN
jgi:hypothetical protein